MKFAKLEGAGNDFIVIEDFFADFKGKEEYISKRVCDRHFGIGADGVLFVRHTNIADIEMVIINNDGSYAAMCGNGLRCFIKYIYEKNIVRKNKIAVLTGDGVKSVELKIEEKKLKEIKVNMGKAEFKPKNIPAISDEKIINKIVKYKNRDIKIISLLVGVPHTIIFNEQFDTELAKYIQNLNIFPEKTNVNFCNIIDENNITVRTFERGVGETLACGTGICASSYVANKIYGLNYNINIKLLNSCIKVEINDDIIYMLGNANFICEGIYTLGE